MSIDLKEIDAVAHLARLDLDETSKKIISQKIIDILKMSESMLNVNTENIAPMISPIEEDHNLREDIAISTITRESLQTCSDHVEDGKYTTPSVIE